MGIMGFQDEFGPGPWRLPKKKKGGACSRPHHLR